VRYLRVILKKTVTNEMGDQTKETDAEGEKIELNYDESTSKGEFAVKVICLGDSAVGKSK
jgi:hypothetical protein